MRVESIINWFLGVVILTPVIVVASIMFLWSRPDQSLNPYVSKIRSNVTNSTQKVALSPKPIPTGMLLEKAEKRILRRGFKKYIGMKNSEKAYIKTVTYFLSAKEYYVFIEVNDSGLIKNARGGYRSMSNIYF